MMRPGRPRAAALPRLWLLLALAGCAGLAPDPRYTSDPGHDPGARSIAVTRELETRQRAQRAGNASRLQRVVQGYLGVPYKWGGTTRSGMDCSALTRAIYREAYGVELPRTSRQMYRLGRTVGPPAQLRPGDLVFFRIDTSGPGVSHVGVYLGDDEFAHASSSRGGTIDRLSRPYFERHYAGARRVLQ